MKALLALLVLLCVLFATASATGVDKKSLKCATCGFLMNQISESTAGLTDPAEIRTAVFGVCSTIPGDKLQSRCTRFISRRGDQIVQKLVKGESLDTVCHCKNKMTVEASTKYCAICQFLVTELENAIRDNEPSLINVLTRACKVLPESYRTSCEGIIETFGPMIIKKFLEKETPEKVCQQIRLCSSAKAEPPVPVSPLGDGLECEFCKFVLNYVEQQISDPTNQEAVERVLQNVCKVVPKQLETSCEAVIKTYYPLLVEYITQKLSPEVICQKIKLCRGEKLIEVPSSPIVDSDLKCTVCKYLMKILENFITGDETAEQLEQLLHKACTYLPHAFEGQCNSLIDAFGPQLVQWIIQHGVKQLDQFCVETGLCSKKIIEESNAKCAVCEFVVAFLEDRLRDDVTQQRIEKLLEEVCNHLPSSVKSQCAAIVSVYTPVIIDWFLNKYPADKLCAQLKLCSGKEFQLEVSKPGQYCAVCQFVMSFVVDYIGKDATEAKIIAAVEKVCDLFPKSLAPTCKAFVETYGPQLIEALLKKETPEVICQQIRACVTAVEEPEQASFLCPACEFVMAELEQFLSQNRTQQEIIEFFKRVCDLVPSNLSSMCHVLVELELPNILEWIKSIPPNQICTAIGACKRQAKTALPINTTILG